MAGPPPHPPPPADLAAKKLPVSMASGDLIRFHRAGAESMSFARSRRNRFDDPLQVYGMLYAGMDEHCAFIETVGWDTGIRFVTRTGLRRMAITRIVPGGRPLVLVDLMASGNLTRVGADARLWSGDYDLAQRWSRAFWEHPSRPDGILYPARHDPARGACAIYDRAAHALTSRRAGLLSDDEHAALLGRILDTYGFGIVGE